MKKSVMVVQIFLGFAFFPYGLFLFGYYFRAYREKKLNAVRITPETTLVEQSKEGEGVVYI